MSVLRPNARLTFRRTVATVPAARDGLVDPWDDPDVPEGELEVVVSDVPTALVSPQIDGIKRGGTRQHVEWIALVNPEDGVLLRAGDVATDDDSDRRWHVDTVVSRVGPPGSILDHVRLTLVSVRGRVDGLV